MSRSHVRVRCVSRCVCVLCHALTFRAWGRRPHFNLWCPCGRCNAATKTSVCRGPGCSGVLLSGYCAALLHMCCPDDPRAVAVHDVNIPARYPCRPKPETKWRKNTKKEQGAVRRLPCQRGGYNRAAYLSNCTEWKQVSMSTSANTPPRSGSGMTPFKKKPNTCVTPPAYPYRSVHISTVSLAECLIPAEKLYLPHFLCVKRSPSTEAKLRSKTSMPDWEAKLGNHTGEQSREAILGSNMGINTGKC